LLHLDEWQWDLLDENPCEGFGTFARVEN